MASETAGEELQGNNLGSIAVSTSFYCKNYGHISVLISFDEDFFLNLSHDGNGEFSNLHRAGREASLFCHLIPGERSVNTAFPPPKNSLCP